MAFPHIAFRLLAHFPRLCYIFLVYFKGSEVTGSSGIPPLARNCDWDASGACKAPDSDSPWFREKPGH
jgi:hypothetical protein